MATDTIKVIIFDCDGVLFDSKAANIAFYNQILASVGLAPMTAEEVEFVHTSTAKIALRYLLARREPQRVEEIIKQQPQVDYTPFISLMRMEPHLRELLNVLPRHIKRAVATNRSYTIGDVLRTHGLATEFDLVVSALDVEKPKPHPEAVLKVLRHFACASAEALFVGDSDVDQIAACEARVPFIAYKNQTLQAEYHIADLLEIAEIITHRERVQSYPSEGGPLATI